MMVSSLKCYWLERSKRLWSLQPAEESALLAREPPILRSRSHFIVVFHTNKSVIDDPNGPITADFDLSKLMGKGAGKPAAASKKMDDGAEAAPV